MKISEMTNGQAEKALLRLAGPFSSICEDDEAVEMIDEYKAAMKKPLFYAIGKVLPKLTAYLLKKHKNDLYEILSVLSDNPPAKIESMNFKDSIKTLRDSWDDISEVFFR